MLGRVMSIPINFGKVFFKGNCFSIAMGLQNDIICLKNRDEIELLCR